MQATICVKLLALLAFWDLLNSRMSREQNEINNFQKVLLPNAFAIPKAWSSDGIYNTK